MVKLFTTQSCSQCPIVKSRIPELPFEVDIIDAEESPEIAAENGVMTVPTIVSDSGTAYVGTGHCMQYIDANK